jgi:hypothetical protein
MTRDELNQLEADLWSAAANLHAHEMGNFDFRPWPGFEE